MTTLIGPDTLARLGLGTGIDATEVLLWRLKEGRTFQEVVGDLALAISAKNEDFNNRWGWLVNYTQEPAMEYPDGGSITMAKRRTDLDTVDAVSGTLIGHMLPLYLHAEGIGGSWKYFQRTREAKVMSAIRTAVSVLESRYEYDLHYRLFRDDDVAIGTGYSVGFVRGTGGAVDFTPPQYGGENFANTHTHYLGFNSSSSATHATMFNGLAETLEEHGHQGPYEAIVSKADITTISALAKFVQPVAPVVTTIDRGGESSGNQLYARGVPMVTNGVFGYFQSEYGLVSLRASYRVPTGYAAMVKSYGVNDPRNPLAVRVAEEGFGINLIAETANNNNQWPIKQVNVVMEMGIGTGVDRTNGAVGYLVAGGTWANPTIN